VNKSRDIKIDIVDADKYSTVDKDKIIPPINTHQSFGRDDPIRNAVAGSTTYSKI